MYKAFVINDIKKPERWERTKDHLEPLQLFDLHRADAIFVPHKPKNWWSISVGECGCKKAHQRLWSDYVQSDVTAPLIIFEDDIGPIEDVSEARANIIRVIEEVDSDHAQYGLLGWCLYRLCTHAYVLNKDGAAKLLKMTGSKCGLLPIDVVMSFSSLCGHIKTSLAHNPARENEYSRGYISQEEETKSTIGNRSVIKNWITIFILFVLHLFAKMRSG